MLHVEGSLIVVVFPFHSGLEPGKKYQLRLRHGQCSDGKTQWEEYGDAVESTSGMTGSNDGKRYKVAHDEIRIWLSARNHGGLQAQYQYTI